jgi:hypothetical protein
MADWATISSLATAGGTLVLATATFAAVRSSNRAARIAEQALQDKRRPVLVHARLDDPVQKLAFGDGHWVRAEGTQAVVEEGNGVIYLALALRNVGSGIAVLQAWDLSPERVTGRSDHSHPETFRRHTRDLYVPPGDVGMWQGALREPTEDLHGGIRAARAERRPFTIDLLYSDPVGEQHTISRFGVTPAGEERWLGSVVRHWPLDGHGPRG